MIVYTGASGSMGSQMPTNCVALRTRLEAAETDMFAELQQVAALQGARITGFVHMAAMVVVTECEKFPEKCCALNVEGAAKWFRAAQRAGVEHFVYVSSAHIYAPPVGQVKLDVDAPLAPRSAYAKSKLEAEGILRDLVKQSSATRLTIARVFGVLSRAMRPGFLLTSLHERARNKNYGPIPGLSNVRDYLYADEICRRLVQLCLAAHTPEIVHICSGKGSSIRDVASEVFRAYGLDPALLTEAPGRPDDIAYLVGEPTLIP